jgi:hypothetical protein
MKIGLGTHVNTMGQRRKMADTRNARLVCQAEFAVTSARSYLPLIKTDGFTACVILALTSPSKMVGGLAHFDVRTMARPSITDIIFPEFRKRHCTDLQAQIVSGAPGDGSQDLAREIRDVLTSKRVEITGLDVGNPKPVPGLILDTVRLELFDIEFPLLPDDAIAYRRRLQAMNYIVQHPDQRLIRLV